MTNLPITSEDLVIATVKLGADILRYKNGSMAAGVRARKAMIALEKRFRAFRKESVAKAKAVKAERKKQREEQKSKQALP